MEITIWRDVDGTYRVNLTPHLQSRHMLRYSHKALQARMPNTNFFTQNINSRISHSLVKKKITQHLRSQHQWLTEAQVAHLAKEAKAVHTESPTAHIPRLKGQSSIVQYK